MGPEGLTDAAAWLTHPRDESTHVAGACQHGCMGWLAWVVGVAVVGGLLVVADRLVASGRLDRFLDRPRAVRTDVGSAAGGLFDSLGDLFQPNREHLTAEKERQRLDIHYAGDDAPPFDLDSGTVVLRPRARPGDEDDARHVAPHPD